MSAHRTMSIYRLKPAFQTLLRPSVAIVYRAGITANQVTIAACAISVALGFGLFFFVHTAAWFALISIWMLVRMVFNAVDGMLAREFGQKSPLGALLNELTDVLSDAALYLPFVAVAPLNAFWVGAFIVLSGLSEYAGALGPTIGAARRYDGPLGKSDRAFVFGVLALWIAMGGALPPWSEALMPILCVAVAWTIVNRMRGALGF
jgi:CDP-diacylglycerol---glycerol-3-phosphate 3-phosphatidyltransferase